MYTFRFTRCMAMALAATVTVALTRSSPVANAEVLSLTEANYEEMTGGKTVFIKFFAPWCGHCKKMAPDWEKLAGEWTDSKVGLIAEVDCTTDEAKPLCEANGVRGFPTLKYGDAASLDDYQGGRTFDDLSKFAKENLKPICSPANLDLCDADKKKQIETMMKLADAEIDEKIKTEEKKLEEAEESFKAAVQELQEKYQKLSKDKDDAIAAVKDSGLGLLKSVKAAKTKGGKDEL